MNLLIQPKSRDEQWEQARKLAAEQQAMRLQRQQQQDFPLPGQVAQAPSPAQAQRVAAAGMIGSKRLAENLEGMLRDKPKFHFFQPQGQAAATATQAAAPAESRPEPVSFIPSQPELELARPERGPRRPAEDPASRDLNLSPQNRQAALTQGLPASQTIRAAASLFGGFSP